MSDLNFRIKIVPKQPINSHDKAKLLIDVREALIICELENAAISYAHINESEKECYPELEELSIQVQAEPGHTYPRQRVQQYREFCERWIRKISWLPYSYITLYGNDCFAKPKQSDHREKYINLSFGVLPHNGSFYQYLSLSPPNSYVHFDHESRIVFIQFFDYQMVFSYDNIRNVFVNINGRPRGIYLDLFNPPRIFREEIVHEHDTSSRTLMHRNLNFHPLIIESTDTQGIDPDILGRANVLSLMLSSHENIQEIIAGIYYECSENSIHYSRISEVKREKPFTPVIGQMPFGCTYLITAILKRNFLAIAQDDDHNLTQLSALSQQNSNCLEKALEAVLLAVDSGKILNVWHAIEDQYRYYKTNKDEISFKDCIIPVKCCLIRRITLTPTRQLLWPPEIMYGNRVLRNFDSEYSLRVSFRDDNLAKLTFSAQLADESVIDVCVKTPMTRGIRIGARHYNFLASSSSQIRDHGAWMYATDELGRAAAHIRQWMGDFSHIYNVPKYMARMGQCFSRTEDALEVPLDPQHVRTENDIEGGYDPVNHKPYCFTDGVGKISSALASKVHRALGHDKKCSAFQIRYGGYKGVLVTDPTLTDAEIVFRKSMKKFDSPQHIRLEIVRPSAPVPLYLNPPFITLLNGLGIRHRIFLRLQEEVLKRYTDMLIDECVAAEALKYYIPYNMFRCEKLSESGIYLTKEPFFKSILLALHRHHIENIKSRANIPIDPSKGRNMLGVVDETGQLEYGEVFVQYTSDIYSSETTSDTNVLTGEVLVTKNPCVYPGDVRKFQAVDIPQLRHIVDCIVFPQKGPRPHSNEMAGSDMDGDEYAVLWDPDLIFKGPNKEPAHFPEVHSPDVPYVTVPHMIDFLQEYIKNDRVGSIASAHLAQADKHGINSDVCLSIAKKFSIAVNFAKTGSTEQLNRNEKPKEYPDFMERSDSVYRSKKALGKMYRVCKDFASENERISIAYRDIKVDPGLIYDGWQEYEKSAINSRNKYNGLLRSVLSAYGVQHEAEPFSNAFTELHCRFQERKDYYNICCVIIGCICKLNSSMRKDFHKEFNGLWIGADEQREKMLQKASAWYIVTYSDKGAEFLSFPWIVSDYLAAIKTKNTSANLPLFSPAILCLDEKIRECQLANLLPHYVETIIWENYSVICGEYLLRRALRTLILWAQDEKIIECETPGPNRDIRYKETFIKLFLHVAELQGYVTRSSKPVSNTEMDYSSGHLCLEFFKFCSSLRFYNKYEVKDILPFMFCNEYEVEDNQPFLYRYNCLATRAAVSYHKFTLSGKLQNLYFDEKVQEELIQMKPVQIDSNILGVSPIHPAILSKAEGVLIKHSKVAELTMCEVFQTKKVSVNARGTQQAINDLKNILRMERVSLMELLNHAA